METARGRQTACSSNTDRMRDGREVDDWGQKAELGNREERDEGAQLHEKDANERGEKRASRQA